MVYAISQFVFRDSTYELNGDTISLCLYFWTCFLECDTFGICYLKIKVDKINAPNYVLSIVGTHITPVIVVIIHDEEKNSKLISLSKLENALAIN